jgi:hypothetical protein
MSTLAFYAQFTKTLVGVNSLTVTWDVEQITRSDGTRSALVTGGATSITIGRRGLYGYLLAAADTKLYDYVATAITAGDVDQKEIAALWTMYEADTLKLSGDAVAADNAEAFFDGTGYAGTNNVIPTVTTLTNMPAAAPNVGAIGTEIWTGTYTRQINSVTGSVGSVSAGVTIAGTLGTLDALWLKIQKWLRLGFRKDAAVATDYAVELGEINANTGTGVGAYTSTTDSQEALRDRGDAAWLSGSAPSTTDIDTVLSATHGAGAWGAGTGVFSKVYTVTSGGLPVDGVYCRLTTDEAGLVNVDAGTTNAAGQVTFHHNLAAGTTVYIHRSKAGFTPVAPEPDVEVI